MRKFLSAMTIAVGITFIAASPVLAKQNPHTEEADGCDHGATGKPCKEDPSENGKDCEVHGNHGGVNEDHCNGETPTTTEPTSPPPVVDEPKPITSTTQPAPAPVVTPEPEKPVTVPVPAPPAPSAPAADVVAETPVSAPASPVAAPAQPVAVTELPHTGAGSWLLMIGMIVFGLGLVFKGASKFIGAGVEVR